MQSLAEQERNILYFFSLFFPCLIIFNKVLHALQKAFALSGLCMGETTPMRLLWPLGKCSLVGFGRKGD